MYNLFFILSSFKLSNKNPASQEKEKYKSISGEFLISSKVFFLNRTVVPLQLIPFSRRSLGHATSCMGEHACLVASIQVSVGNLYAISPTQTPALQKVQLLLPLQFPLQLPLIPRSDY